MAAAKPHFCTYFDLNYLTRGLALYESLVRHCHDFRLWILCLDEATCETLSRLRLDQVSLIRVAELEAMEPGLAEARKNRNRLEFYYTCTPLLPAFVLQREPSAARVTYLDADLWFFSDPQAVFDEIGEAPIAVVPHRFHGQAAELAPISGRFNVSWVSFDRTETAARCLARWRAQCLEWCFDRPEAGKNADQKYLEEWPSLYPGLHVIGDIGAGCAPWNVAAYRLRESDGRVLLDGRPLVFFHFHGLRQFADHTYDPVISHFHARMTREVQRHIYLPYLAVLRALSREVFGALAWDSAVASIRVAPRPDYGQLRPWARLRRFAHGWRRILSRTYIFAPWLDARADALRPGLLRTVFANRDAATRGGPRS